MSTTTQTTQTSTGLIGLRHRISAVVNDPDFAATFLRVGLARIVLLHVPLSGGRLHSSVAVTILAPLPMGAAAF
jgi:hypothetical protein